MKTCSKCGVEKEETEFYRHYAKCKACVCGEHRAKYAENPEVGRGKRRKTYYRRYRSRNRSVIRARQKQWYLDGSNVSKAQARNRRRNYGMTEEQYQRVLKEQDGRCACCRDEFVGTPHVDHVHGSNPIVVRGLLCRFCNAGMAISRIVQRG